MVVCAGLNDGANGSRWQGGWHAGVHIGWGSFVKGSSVHDELRRKTLTLIYGNDYGPAVVTSAIPSSPLCICQTQCLYGDGSGAIVLSICTDRPRLNICMAIEAYYQSQRLPRIHPACPPPKVSNRLLTTQHTKYMAQRALKQSLLRPVVMSLSHSTPSTPSVPPVVSTPPAVPESDAAGPSTVKISAADKWAKPDGPPVGVTFGARRIQDDSDLWQHNAWSVSFRAG